MAKAKAAKAKKQQVTEASIVRWGHGVAHYWNLKLACGHTAGSPAEAITAGGKLGGFVFIQAPPDAAICGACQAVKP